MRNRWIFAFLFAASMTVPSTANAGAIGATVNLDFFFPDMATLHCGNGLAVVGGGVEYPAGCDGFSPASIDIFDDHLIVDTGGVGWAATAFNGFRLQTTLGPDFLTAVYGGGSMNVSSLLVSAGDLWVNFQGQGGGVARIDFTTGSAAVPEPATLSLLASGLGLAAARRRRRRLQR